MVEPLPQGVGMLAVALASVMPPKALWAKVKESFRYLMTSALVFRSSGPFSPPRSTGGFSPRMPAANMKLAEAT